LVLNSWKLKIGSLGRHRYLVQRWKILQFEDSQVVGRWRVVLQYDL
jgi:hypothetical protein